MQAMLNGTAAALQQAGCEWKPKAQRKTTDIIPVAYKDGEPKEWFSTYTLNLHYMKLLLKSADLFAEGLRREEQAFVGHGASGMTAPQLQ